MQSFESEEINQERPSSEVSDQENELEKHS
jgi:hypothetical protein